MFEIICDSEIRYFIMNVSIGNMIDESIDGYNLVEDIPSQEEL